MFSMTMPGMFIRLSRRRSTSRFMSLMAYCTSLTIPRMTRARNIFLGDILIFIAGYLMRTQGSSVSAAAPTAIVFPAVNEDIMHIPPCEILTTQRAMMSLPA